MNNNQCGNHGEWRYSRFLDCPGTLPSESALEAGKLKLALEKDKSVEMDPET